MMTAILESFTTLARTQNLSRTVSILGTTRQTVRRHVQLLEKIKGEKLFQVHDRRYELTEFGAGALEDAEFILSRCDSWIAGHRDSVRGLARIIYNADEHRPFYAQQHPISELWRSGPPLLHSALAAWVESQAQLEHQAMHRLQPYLVAYRKRSRAWLCVSVGEKSSYATWLGWTWAKSAVGSELHEDAMHSPADEFVEEAYESACFGAGIRLDHVATYIPRTASGPPLPISYQRLLLGCHFPDGQPALVTAVARTQNISVDGVATEDLPLSPEADLMEFDL